MFKASLYILSFPNQLYCVSLYFFVTSFNPWWWIDEISAIISIVDVVMEGGDPTSCAMNEGLATLFSKVSIMIC